MMTRFGGSKQQAHDHATPAPKAEPTRKQAVAPAPLSSLIRRAATRPASLTRTQTAQLQRAMGDAALARRVGDASRRTNETGLPDRLKLGLESLSNIVLDEVRVHYNSSEPAQLEALAYTRGADIYVAPGQELHLPHEAWHVVQQAQGRVKPTMQMKGHAVNDDARLEREAESLYVAHVKRLYG